MDKKKGCRVVFVEPRGAYASVYDRFMTIPLLGPIYLGTIAKQAGYDVSVINENILGRDINKQEFNADVLCLSCISSTVGRGKEIAQQYKKFRKEKGLESRVLIGGIHASMMPYDVINDFDQVIVGESEEIILPLLENKIENKIIYAKRLENLDDLPSPDFSIIKQGYKMNVFPIMTSRGCPYNCNFCAVTKMFGRGYRAQSPERVIKEIKILKKYMGMGKRIFIADDHLSANVKRLEKILDMMIAESLKINCSAQVRTEVTKEPRIVKKMRKAGLKDVYVGLESINPQTLIEINKGQTVSDIERSIRVFHDYGIGICGMTIFGSDSDTKDIFKKTSDFYQKTRLDYFQGTVLTPLVGTDLYKKLEQEDRFLTKDWSVYDAMHVVFKPKQMTPYELQQGFLRCYNDFYSFENGVRNVFRAFAGHLPSFNVPVMNFIGRLIVKDWTKQNKDYFKYLKKIS